MRPLAAVLVALVLAGCGSDAGSSSSATSSIKFLGGGRDAFEAFVKKQRGTPVVVNKWASWCGPCREEFPYLRREATRLKGKVVFVGVDSNDNDGDAKKFLAANPVPYRHFTDPKLEIAAAFNGVQAFPTTAFYDTTGKLQFVHQGLYTSQNKLAEDIARYAR